jgi:hypothetical protein
MQDSSRKLVGYWKSLNLVIAAAATEKRVLEFESHYGVVLPADFREYFLDVNGMLHRRGQDCHPNGFAFWPLGRVKSACKEYAEHSTALPEVPAPHAYFVFADYLHGAGPTQSVFMTSRWSRTRSSPSAPSRRG